MKATRILLTISAALSQKTEAAMRGVFLSVCAFVDHPFTPKNGVGDGKN